MNPRFETPLRIRFAHCDPAGIVFFPQYLVMLNGLVEDWFTDGLGVPYAELLGPRRTGVPIVQLQCEFSAISRMGDVVTFGLVTERVGGRSLTLALTARVADELRVTAACCASAGLMRTSDVAAPATSVAFRRRSLLVVVTTHSDMQGISSSPRSDSSNAVSPDNNSPSD